jgi:D-alanyl-D-alanine carboxypeptidase (penicillin-binding protein 5/6)
VPAKNLIQTHPIADDIQASSVVRYQQPVLAPIQKGQKLGTITTLLPDKTLVETDLIAAENVEKLGFFAKIKALLTGG